MTLGLYAIWTAVRHPTLLLPTGKRGWLSLFEKVKGTAQTPGDVLVLLMQIHLIC